MQPTNVAASVSNPAWRLASPASMSDLTFSLIDTIASSRVSAIVAVTALVLISFLLC